MRKYAATIRVLVTLRVKESPTAESGTPEWTAGTGNQVARTRVAVAFVRDAVASWGGQAPPDYVFFPTNLEVTACVPRKPSAGTTRITLHRPGRRPRRLA